MSLYIMTFYPNTEKYYEYVYTVYLLVQNAPLLFGPKETAHTNRFTQTLLFSSKEK